MYKYVKVNGKVENQPIPEESQINDLVVRKIRQRYTVNDELKMARIDNSSQEWVDYNDYVETCRDWGNTRKAEAANDREAWKDNQWDIEQETRNEFIQRMEDKGLI